MHILQRHAVWGRFEMRKEIIPRVAENIPEMEESCSRVQNIAVVQLTSEDPSHPIESALLPGEQRGWRAAEAGTQSIRLIFNEPQRLKRISVIFEETENNRTQEFLLRWSGNGGKTFREIVRQQWTFSAPNTVREIENYSVELSSVTQLELIVVPDINGREVRASVKSLRLT